MSEALTRVVVCDDDPLMQKLLVRLLGTLDCEIVGSGQDGNEGIALFNSQKPDIVLMDINMPGKDGQAALREILQIDPAAKVIMLSAMEDTDVVETCIQDGAVGYIRKGTGLGELQAALAGQLEKVRG